MNTSGMFASRLMAGLIARTSKPSWQQAPKLLSQVRLFLEHLMRKPQSGNSEMLRFNGSDYCEMGIGNGKLAILQGFGEPDDRKLNPIAVVPYSHKQVLFWRFDLMKSRFLILAVFCALIPGVPGTGFAQKPGSQ